MHALLAIDTKAGSVRRYERGSGGKVVKTHEAVIAPDFDASVGVKALETFLKQPHLLDLAHDAPPSAA
jgi:hypothetical protein